MKYFGIMMVLLTVLSYVASQDIHGNSVGSEILEETNEGSNIRLQQLKDYMKQTKNMVTNENCTTAGEYFCNNCMTPAFCNENKTVTLQDECKNGEACIVDYGISFCSTEKVKCDCDGTSTGCDSEQPNNVLYCDTDGPFFSNPCAVNNTCSEGQCIVSQSGCPANVTGWLPVGPDCKTAHFCNNGTELKSSDCKDGEYYDPVVLKCQAAPPKPCGNECEGYCPHPVDCTKYHVCDGEGNSVKLLQCAEGKKFNPLATPPGCDDSNVICPLTEVCTDTDANTEELTTPSLTTEKPTTPSPTTPSPTTPSPTTVKPTTPSPTTPNLGDTTTTTTTTTTAPTTTEGNKITTPAPSTCNENTIGTMSPHVDNCKMYYICSKTTTADYEYVERTCVSILVFNPVTLKCDMPENVPDCVPT